MDLIQDGQADMDSINDQIDFLQIKKEDRVLDLGCGAGGISEYISDHIGAHVTGLDYAATAMETARGEFARGVAMSLLLLLMAMVLTVAIAWLMRTEDEQ